MNLPLLFIFLTTAHSQSNDSLSIGINVFMRSQTGKNFFIYRYSRPVLTEQRFTPFIILNKGKITVKTSLEMVHRWTQFVSKPQQPYEYSKLSILYAGENWVSWKPLKNLELKVGRQAVTYGTGRIFGVEDWNLVVTYPDMLRLKYSISHWLVELGGGWFFPPELELVAPLLQRGFHIMHIQRDSFFLTGLSEYRIGMDSFWVWRHTMGGQLPVEIVNNRAVLNLFVEGYFQFGVTDRFIPAKGISRIPIKAFMFVLRTTGQVKNLYGQMSAVIISGQSMSTINSFEGSFYTEMGLWHKYYGLMNWYINPSDWGYAGLLQTEIIVGLQFNRWRVQINGSLFRSLYQPIAYTPYLSSEGTLLVSYSHNKAAFEISGTYGHSSQYLRSVRSLPKIGSVPKTGYAIWITIRLNMSKNLTNG